jgi:biofilm PGA synthesis N-glycosyltransferase PgaC
VSQASNLAITALEEQTYKVALLIPAHNEEECIQNTILSVLKQTARALPNVQVDIYIIADNCTDQTEKIVSTLIEGLKGQERQSVFLLRSKNNKSKKAGALNQGYQKIRAIGYTHFATADADTVWDPLFLEHGLAEWAKHKEPLGGVCGRVGLLPYRKDPFKQIAHTNHPLLRTGIWVLNCFLRIGWALRQEWKNIWWSFQNLEYSLAQSEIVERMGQAHCLCGPGTIYRAEVLDQLYQQFGLVWPKTMVEDFDITKRIQTMKYKTVVGLDMFVYTDCPIGFKAHRIQRERWNGGNLSTYMRIGVRRHTVLGGLEMGWQLIWFACRLNLLITLIQIYVSGFVYIDRLGFTLLAIPMLLTTLLNLFRFKYVAYKSFFQFLLIVCLGYEVYALWYGVVLTKSYFKAFTHSLTRWR